MIFLIVVFGIILTGLSLAACGDASKPAKKAKKAETETEKKSAKSSASSMKKKTEDLKKTAETSAAAKAKKTGTVKKSSKSSAASKSKKKDKIVKWVIDAVENHAEEANMVSDSIWATPELSGYEYTSSKTLMTALRNAGFTITNPVADIETAFTAKYGKGSPVIGLLAEYDCVSGLSQMAGVLEPKPITKGGNGHGCGHNLLGAGCYAAALALKDYIDENDAEGTVILFGCPAEETGGGKTFMARAGLFDKVDVALSWHPYDYNLVLPMSPQADVRISYSFVGKASHAAAAPAQGRSALDAVELMNVGANYLREHVNRDVIFHYAVTDTGGSSPNVVQPTACVDYLIRGENLNSAKDTRARIDDIAKGAALMTGTKVNILFRSGCSDCRVNTVVGDVVYQSMRELGKVPFTDADKKVAADFTKTLDNPGPGRLMRPILDLMVQHDASLSYVLTAPYNDVTPPYVPLETWTPSTTDVGDVSKNCPTIMFTVATCAQGTAGHSWQMVSQGTSSMAHTGMHYAAKVMTLTAIRFMQDSKLVSNAWSEFKLENAGGYECPIPDDITFESAIQLSEG